MLSEIKKISIHARSASGVRNQQARFCVSKNTYQQWFIVVVFVVAMFLSFSAGYVYFRYWSAEACKSPMELVKSTKDVTGIF